MKWGSDMIGKVWIGPGNDDGSVVAVNAESQPLHG